MQEPVFIPTKINLILSGLQWNSVLLRLKQSKSDFVDK